MVLRLVLDIARRGRVMFLIMVPFVALVWTFIAGVGRVDGQPDDYELVTLGLTLSMGFAYILGPIISVTMVGRREIRILPLTNRDLWVATWLFATLVIPLAVTVVQCVAVIAVATFTGSSAVSTENLLLASLYCFAYAGALVPIVPAQGYATNNITTRQTVAVAEDVDFCRKAAAGTA
jgi:hypothetical protein